MGGISMSITPITTAVYLFHVCKARCTMNYHFLPRLLLLLGLLGDATGSNVPSCSSEPPSDWMVR
jgi:hypothetical protein